MAKTKQFSFKKEGKNVLNPNETIKQKDKSTKQESTTQNKKNLKTRVPQLPDISLESRKKRKKKKMRKKLLIWTGVFVFLFILFFYVLILEPAFKVQRSLSNIKETSSILFSDIENKNLTNFETNLDIIGDELTFIVNQLDKYSFLNLIPFTQGYYKNVEHVKVAVEKSDRLLEENITEIQDVLLKTGFTVDGVTIEPIDEESSVFEEVELDEDGNPVEPSASSMVLAELPSFISLYEKMEPEILEIFEELSKLDTDYLPSFAGYNIKDNVESFQEFAYNYPEISTQSIEFLKYVPELIGSNDGPTDYLVILQNESEMRASGGLLTAFGHMQLVNGEFNGEISFSDMWNLENNVSYTLGVDTGHRNIYGQNYLMNQGCGSNYLRAQDSGIYPDLYWTMNIFRDYYDTANAYNKVDYPDYDHILILDHHFAENILSLIQPLEVEGYGEVTAENLFEFIKEETDDPTLSFSPERKAIIKDIANAAKEKFLELPLSDMSKMTSIFVQSINAKDIGFYSEEEDMQEFFDKYSMSGRIVKDFNGDYFHLNEAQNCSLKLNKYVRNNVIQDIFISDTGDISKDVQVNWEQPKVYEESLRLQYDPDGFFTYRAWVRIFAPLEVATFESDGLKKSGFLYYQPQEYNDDEMEKAVSDNVIRFDHRRLSEDDPIPGQDLNVSYALPSNLNYDLNGEYRMLIQKHPGKSWGEEYIINIHHNDQIHTIEFVLDRDKVISYKNGIITVSNYESKLDWLVELVEGLPLNLLDN